VAPPGPLASKGGLLLRGEEGSEGNAFRQINICHYTTARNPCNCMDYYSFTDSGGTKG